MFEIRMQSKVNHLALSELSGKEAEGILAQPGSSLLWSNERPTETWHCLHHCLLCAFFGSLQFYKITKNWVFGILNAFGLKQFTIVWETSWQQLTSLLQRENSEQILCLTIQTQRVLSFKETLSLNMTLIFFPLNIKQDAPTRFVS